MAVNQVLDFHTVKRLEAILGVLARPNVLGVVGSGVWHPALCRGTIG
jgi:hypothetical protein